MILSLNLVSPTEKKKLIEEKIVSLIKDFILLMLFTLILNSTFIFISRYILDNNFSQIASQKESLIIQNQPLNQEIASINERLKKARDLQSSYTKWSDNLYSFIQLVPPEIQIYHLDLNQESLSFSITGIAKTRDSFIAFKENLEKSQLFEEIDSPLSNLLYQENLDFNLKGKLKL